MTRLGLPAGSLGMELTVLHLWKLACSNKLYRASDLYVFFESTLFAVVNKVTNVTFEILLAATIKMIVIWDVMLYSLCTGSNILEDSRWGMFSHAKYYPNIDAETF
jgi:hypothetical protein